MRLRPDPAGGAYSAPPDPLAGNGGPREGGGKARKEEREKRGGEGTEGEEREGLSPRTKILATALKLKVKGQGQAQQKHINNWAVG